MRNTCGEKTANEAVFTGKVVYDENYNKPTYYFQFECENYKVFISLDSIFEYFYKGIEEKLLPRSLFYWLIDNKSVPAREKMKKYKARVNSKKEYAVTREEFEEARLDNPHLYQDGKYYGVCPYCNSPVKLVGLEHEIKLSNYARHTQGSVFKVAEKTAKAMVCPANTHKRTADADERMDYEDDENLIIKNEMIGQFDVIAKIINRYSDIYYSFDQKIQLFINAYKSKIWLYPLCDQSNVPWIILYCKQSEEITHRLIKNDSSLFQFLKSRKVRLIASSKTRNYSFIDKRDYGIVENMRYSFTFHNRYLDINDDYRETLYAVLSRSKQYNTPPEDGYTEFFKKKIEIDHQEFNNKINYYNENNLRDASLLEKVKEIVRQNSRW